MTEQQEIKTEQTSASSPFPMKAILGRKVGMTQIFSDKGEIIPVSVIYVGDCTTTDVKTPERDGYSAVQIGIGTVKPEDVDKATAARFAKKNIAPVSWLKEFRVQDAGKFQIGQKVSADVFAPGDYVDVTGVSKGKGFAGVIKRHNFHRQPVTHGASDRTRARGSSSGCSGSGQRVLKGTRMAGRLGGETISTLKIEVVKVDMDNSLLLVKGSIPGSSKGFVIVKETSRHLKHKKPVGENKKSVKKVANVAKKAAPAKK